MAWWRRTVRRADSHTRGGGTRVPGPHLCGHAVDNLPARTKQLHGGDSELVLPDGPANEQPTVPATSLLEELTKSLGRRVVLTVLPALPLLHQRRLDGPGGVAVPAFDRMTADLVVVVAVRRVRVVVVLQQSPLEHVAIDEVVAHADQAVVGAIRHPGRVVRFFEEPSDALLVVDVDDRPGVLADLASAVSNAGVDLALVFVATNNRLVLGAADMEALGQVFAKTA